jgi:glutaredoxin
MMLIEIYSKRGCPVCSWARDYLTEKGMPYVEKVLGEDFTREFITETFPVSKTYPVIVVDGMNVNGFDGMKKYLEEYAVHPTLAKLLLED